MIRLRFVCGYGLASKAIAWFGAEHLSHVDAVLPNGMLLGSRSDTVGGMPPGVQVRSPNYEPVARTVDMAIPATPDQTDAFYAFLFDQIGKPYDHAAIWGFVFNRDWRDEDSWFCMELIAAAGEAAKLYPRLFLAANKITPVSGALAYSAIGGKVT